MEILKQIFAELVVTEHNMRMLHWNVRGSNFDGAHGKFEEYVTEIGKFIDEIAEIMLMFNENPIDLQSCIDITTKSDNELIYLRGDEKYPASNAFAICDKIFESLLRSYVKASQEELPDDIKGKLDEHTYFFRLELRYKGVSRQG